MRKIIVIVGGGFCGTVLAANLLRRPPADPTDIVLIERGAAMGRGARLSIQSDLCLVGSSFHRIAKALAGLDRRIREDTWAASGATFECRSIEPIVACEEASVAPTSLL